MIKCPCNRSDIDALISSFSPNSVEYKIITSIDNSNKPYNYNYIGQLEFEVAYRKKIIDASKDLFNSDLRFETFRDAKCNNYYWNRLDNGGFELKQNANCYNAINDIYMNGRKYATECATAMVIVYYKALADLYPIELFNKLFKNTTLMNWSYINPLLKETGLLYNPNKHEYLPGDRRYFKNPDVNLKTPQWQGENVIDLGNGHYFGHGMSRLYTADKIIENLNKNRKKGSTTSAYLMDELSIPNFNRICDLLKQYDSQMTG